MSEVDKILEEWYHAKEQLKKYEIVCDKLKDKVTLIMDKNNTSKLSSEKYIVTKRSQITSRISKNLVPNDIWEKYSVASKFDVYSIKKNK